MRNPYKDEQYRKIPGNFSYPGADQDDRDVVTLFHVICELDANGHFTDLREELAGQLGDLFEKAPEKDGIRSMAGGYLKYRRQGLIESGDYKTIPASPFGGAETMEKKPDGIQDIAGLIRKASGSNWWGYDNPYVYGQFLHILDKKAKAKPDDRIDRHLKSIQSIVEKLENTSGQDAGGDAVEKLFDKLDRQAQFGDIIYGYTGRSARRRPYSHIWLRKSYTSNKQSAVLCYMTDETVRQFTKLLKSSALTTDRIYNAMLQHKDNFAKLILPHAGLFMNRDDFMDGEVEPMPLRIGQKNILRICSMAADKITMNVWTLMALRKSILTNTQPGFVETCYDTGIFDRDYQPDEDLYRRAGRLCLNKKLSEMTNTEPVTRQILEQRMDSCCEILKKKLDGPMPRTEDTILQWIKD